MKILLGWVSGGRGRSKSDEMERLVEMYAGRAGRYMTTEVASFESEATLLGAAERGTSRAAAWVVLLEARGEMLTSEEFAWALRKQRDLGVQRAVVGVGPADGWSAVARARADVLLSLGKVTLPHGLARVVAAEQVYRALTILAGHPYHCGH